MRHGQKVFPPREIHRETVPTLAPSTEAPINNPLLYYQTKHPGALRPLRFLNKNLLTKKKQFRKIPLRLEESATERPLRQLALVATQVKEFPKSSASSR